MDSAFFIVMEKLLAIIRDKKFENNKLYSEEMLVKKLDASRGTVREVLRSLARKGIITKKHGIGNFVHPRAMDMKMRFDEIQDFIELIEDGGYQGSIKRDEEPFYFSLSDQGHENNLGPFLEKDLKYYCVTRIYLADECPTIYCQMFFPVTFFVTEPVGEVKFNNVFDFVRAYFDQEIEQTLVWISAESAGEEISKKLGVSLGTALLVWDELLCNYKDQVVGYSKIYFKPDVMKISMLKKIS